MRKDAIKYILFVVIFIFSVAMTGQTISNLNFKTCLKEELNNFDCGVTLDLKLNFENQEVSEICGFWKNYFDYNPNNWDGSLLCALSNIKTHCPGVNGLYYSLIEAKRSKSKFSGNSTEYGFILIDKSTFESLKIIEKYFILFHELAHHYVESEAVIFRYQNDALSRDRKHGSNKNSGNPYVAKRKYFEAVADFVAGYFFTFYLVSKGKNKSEISLVFNHLSQYLGNKKESKRYPSSFDRIELVKKGSELFFRSSAAQAELFKIQSSFDEPISGVRANYYNGNRIRYLAPNEKFLDLSAIRVTKERIEELVNSPGWGSTYVAHQLIFDLARHYASSFISEKDSWYVKREVPLFLSTKN